MSCESVGVVDRAKVVSERLAGCVDTWPTLDAMLADVLSDVLSDVPCATVRPGDTPRVPMHRQLVVVGLCGPLALCCHVVTSSPQWVLSACLGESDAPLPPIPSHVMSEIMAHFFPRVPVATEALALLADLLQVDPSTVPVNVHRGAEGVTTAWQVLTSTDGRFAPDLLALPDATEAEVDWPDTASVEPVSKRCMVAQLPLSAFRRRLASPTLVGIHEAELEQLRAKLAAYHVAVVHGPCGTGKRTLAAQAIGDCPTIEIDLAVLRDQRDVFVLLHGHVSGCRAGRDQSWVKLRDGLVQSRLALIVLSSERMRIETFDCLARLAGRLLVVVMIGRSPPPAPAEWVVGVDRLDLTQARALVEAAGVPAAAVDVVAKRAVLSPRFDEYGRPTQSAELGDIQVIRAMLQAGSHVADRRVAADPGGPACVAIDDVPARSSHLHTFQRLSWAGLGPEHQLFFYALLSQVAVRSETRSRRLAGLESVLLQAQAARYARPYHLPPTRAELREEELRVLRPEMSPETKAKRVVAERNRRRAEFDADWLERMVDRGLLARRVSNLVVRSGVRGWMLEHQRRNGTPREQRSLKSTMQDIDRLIGRLAALDGYFGGALTVSACLDDDIDPLSLCPVEPLLESAPLSILAVVAEEEQTSERERMSARAAELDRRYHSTSKRMNPLVDALHSLRAALADHVVQDETVKTYVRLLQEADPPRCVMRDAVAAYQAAWAVVADPAREVDCIAGRLSYASGPERAVLQSQLDYYGTDEAARRFAEYETRAGDDAAACRVAADLLEARILRTDHARIGIPEWRFSIPLADAVYGPESELYPPVDGATTGGADFLRSLPAAPPEPPPAAIGFGSDPVFRVAPRPGACPGCQGALSMTDALRCGHWMHYTCLLEQPARVPRTIDDSDRDWIEQFVTPALGYCLVRVDLLADVSRLTAEISSTRRMSHRLVSDGMNRMARDLVAHGLVDGPDRLAAALVETRSALVSLDSTAISLGSATGTWWDGRAAELWARGADLMILETRLVDLLATQVASGDDDVVPRMVEEINRVSQLVGSTVHAAALLALPSTAEAFDEAISRTHSLVMRLRRTQDGCQAATSSARAAADRQRIDLCVWLSQCSDLLDDPSDMISMMHAVRDVGRSTPSGLAAHLRAIARLAGPSGRMDVFRRRATGAMRSHAKRVDGPRASTICAAADVIDAIIPEYMHRVVLLGCLDSAATGSTVDLCQALHRSFEDEIAAMRRQLVARPRQLAAIAARLTAAPMSVPEWIGPETTDLMRQRPAWLRNAADACPGVRGAAGMDCAGLAAVGREIQAVAEVAWADRFDRLVGTWCVANAPEFVLLGVVPPGYAEGQLAAETRELELAIDALPDDAAWSAVRSLFERATHLIHIMGVVDAVALAAHTSARVVEWILARVEKAVWCPGCRAAVGDQTTEDTTRRAVAARMSVSLELGMSIEHAERLLLLSRPHPCVGDCDPRPAVPLLDVLEARIRDGRDLSDSRACCLARAFQRHPAHKPVAALLL
jgi:hypothetical protein